MGSELGKGHDGSRKNHQTDHLSARWSTISARPDVLKEYFIR
jgi:hypothetical protein